MNQFWLFVGFNVLILLMLAIDLGVFNRKAHTVGMREAGTWCLICVTVALAFNYGILHFRGSEMALQFLQGYLLELALSVDNIFVFVLIFSYFQVPSQFQHRVLFWGIFGALVMRGIMIGIGAFLISRFDWILYVFGAFLVVTGLRMAVQKDQHIEPEANPALRLVRKLIPVTTSYHGQRFFIRDDSPGSLARLMATPLFVVLVLIETTDLVFAVDSIPAVFGITQDPLIVYTSNVFAILCLRSMYFILAGIMDQFRFLQLGLSVVLCFIGVKMLAHDWIHLPEMLSLSVIAAVLVLSVLASMLLPAKSTRNAGPDAGPAVAPTQKHATPAGPEKQVEVREPLPK